MRWLSRIFNRNGCIYQTAIRWDAKSYLITIWLIDWWYNVCLFTWWFDSRFLLQKFDAGKRWIWILIGYHPCITSKPTNQVCFVFNIVGFNRWIHVPWNIQIWNSTSKEVIKSFSNSVSLTYYGVILNQGNLIRFRAFVCKKWFDIFPKDLLSKIFLWSRLF